MLIDPLKRFLALAGGMVVAILLALLFIQKGETASWKEKQERTASDLSAEQSAHRLTVANYRAASSEAQRRFDAAKAALATDYLTQGRKAEDAFANDVATLRRLAAAGQLRPALAETPAYRGGPGRPDVAGTPPPPCRAADPAWLCLSPSDVLRAAEAEARHDRLIDYELGVSTPPKKDAPASP